MQALFHLSLAILFTFFFSCSSSEKSSETPEGVYAIAEEFEKDERFDQAIRRYQEVKNKFPYSNYATKAELAIADVHFKDEAYPEAQVAYQAFKELHPKHPQIDYVTFRIGLSFYKQLPDSIDRDLTLASEAIGAFNELIKLYPRSEYLKEASEKQTDCLRQLAEKEIYIADFYYKRENYLSAFLRYESLLEKYPGQSFEATALSKAAISAHKSSHLDKAHFYLKRLQNKYSNSPELDAAKRIVE